MVCLCLFSTKVWSAQNIAMRRRAQWSKLQNISTAEFLQLRGTTGSSSQTKAEMENCSVFLDAAFLCMDPNYDVEGLNFVVTPFVTPCSSHHPPTDCWHPLSSTISPFPRDWGAFREEFHPKGTSMEWLTWKIFLVQKCNLYIYFTKDRVTT